MENDKDQNTRKQFGNRFLIDKEDVFEHNAWDNVEWDAEMEYEAQDKVLKASLVKMKFEDQIIYVDHPEKFWNEFYGTHQDKFFKDRNWLFTEFPELEFTKTSPDTIHNFTIDEKIKVFEVGCGVGNTVFPILQTNNDPNLFVYCCDLSFNAINILKNNPFFDKNRCEAFVCDVTNENTTFPFKVKSLDIIIMIFCLSSICPKKMPSLILKLSSYLKEGGLILFRDYGLYDMAQLRFKQGKCIEDNFYVRGDGTLVYFFKQDELRNLFTSAGLEEEQNLVDRRLQVNRGRQLKMFRVWIQCKYRKPRTSD